MDKTADLVLDAQDTTGEGPVWCPRTALLWWTDIPGKRLHRLDPASGAHEVFATPGRVGCFALREQGDGLLVAMDHAIGILQPETGRFTQLVEVETDKDKNRFNDGRCDRRGRLFAGTMTSGTDAPADGALWRYTSPDDCVRVADGVGVANGLAFSPDDKLMHWSDTRVGRIWRFDYDIDTGTLANRQLWIDADSSHPGMPDGAAIDAEGCYWSARWNAGCVLRITPAGRVDRVVRVPATRITMCAFGGPDLRTLYITSARSNITGEELRRQPHAGGLFAVDAGVEGLPEPRAAA